MLSLKGSESEGEGNGVDDEPALSHGSECITLDFNLNIMHHVVHVQDFSFSQTASNDLSECRLEMIFTNADDTD